MTDKDMQLGMESKSEELKAFLVGTRFTTQYGYVEQKLVVARNATHAIEVAMRDDWGWNTHPTADQLVACEVPLKEPALIERFYYGD